MKEDEKEQSPYVERKKEALLSAKEVKKFVAEWRNNLIKTDKSS